MDNLSEKLKKLTNQAAAIGTSVKNSFLGITELEERLKQERLNICKSCPLYQDIGNRVRCNPDLLINAKNQTVSNTPENKKKYPSFVEGCGCTLDNYGNTVFGEKPTVVGKGNTCPANKWNEVEMKYLKLDPDRKLTQEFLELGITMYAYKHNLDLKFRDL